MTNRRAPKRKTLSPRARSDFARGMTADLRAILREEKKERDAFAREMAKDLRAILRAEGGVIRRKPRKAKTPREMRRQSFLRELESGEVSQDAIDAAYKLRDRSHVMSVRYYGPESGMPESDDVRLVEQRRVLVGTRESLLRSLSRMSHTGEILEVDFAAVSREAKKAANIKKSRPLWKDEFIVTKDGATVKGVGKRKRSALYTKRNAKLKDQRLLERFKRLRAESSEERKQGKIGKATQKLLEFLDKND
jgi:hypothetical protein